MLDLQEQRQNYSVQQFVEPGSGSGIPVSYGVGFSAMGSLGGVSGNINTPSNTDGANSGAAFGGLSGAGAPPQ